MSQRRAIAFLAEKDVLLLLVIGKGTAKAVVRIKASGAQWHLKNKMLKTDSDLSEKYTQFSLCSSCSHLVRSLLLKPILELTIGCADNQAWPWACSWSHLSSNVLSCASEMLRGRFLQTISYWVSILSVKPSSSPGSPHSTPQHLLLWPAGWQQEWRLPWLPMLITLRLTSPCVAAYSLSCQLEWWCSASSVCSWHLSLGGILSWQQSASFSTLST